jgi:hypothetical protein
MAEFVSDLVWRTLRNAGATLQAIAPGVLAMLTLLALGVVLGWVVGAILARLARAVDLDRRGRAWGLSAMLGRAGVGRPPSEVLRAVVFWGTVLFAAAASIDVLNVPGAPGATGFLMQFLPRILSAGLILVVGFLSANFLGQAVLVGAVNAGVPEARLLARFVRWAILLFAIATALTEIGIGRDMVRLAFAITFGGVVLALALAFGLGGRGLARDVLERRLGRRRTSEPEETLTHL